MMGVSFVLEGQSVEVRIEFGSSPFTSVSLLAVLASDCSYLVRKAVAGNVSASAETLALLSVDCGKLIRELVALHRNTPVAVLDVLSQDGSYVVREAVRRNPKWFGR